MKLSITAAWVAATIVVSILWCPSARAQSEGGTDLAETHFKAASAYYNQGKYQKALEEFNEAYRLMPLPEITFNIAQCHERLGDLEKAIETYKKYIEEKPDAKDIQAVKDKIASLEERLEETGITVKVSEEGAAIFIDDQEVATSPVEGLIKVAAGSHTLKVEKEGFKTYTMNFSVVAGLSQSADVVLTAESKGTGEVEGEGGGTVEAQPRKGAMAGYIAGYSVSGALLLGGVVTGALALVNVNKYNDNTDSNYDHKAKTLALVTDVLIPVGVAGIVITSIVLGVKKPWKATESKKVSLVPCIAPGSGGLLLRGSF